MSRSPSPLASPPEVPAEVPAEAPESSSKDLATTNDTPERKVKKIIRRKRRPARPQVDPSFLPDEPPPQTGTVFNIWYNKWSGGDREDKFSASTKAKGRCDVARDAGFTKADATTGSYFCLFFARGICPKGQDCSYLHRLPTLHDMFNPNVDCFGRDKFSDYRDDMGGVGSFLRQNRTVYVGRIHVSDDIEEVVARHFAEWGQIERRVAFITYSNEANAQFAKEAMAHQSLDHEEILNVRWATADPNPMARAREARAIEEQAAEAIRRALPAEYVAELEGKDAGKRRKLTNSYGLAGYEAPDDIHYARGANVVNPHGRDPIPETQELHHELPALEPAPPDALSQLFPQQTSRSLLSQHTLAALQSAQVTASAKAPSQAAGPLVAYDSDSE